MHGMAFTGRVAGAGACGACRRGRAKNEAPCEQVCLFPFMPGHRRVGHSGSSNAQPASIVSFVGARPPGKRSPSSPSHPTGRLGGAVLLLLLLLLWLLLLLLLLLLLPLLLLLLPSLPPPPTPLSCQHRGVHGRMPASLSGARSEE